ncbi:hypothetical protein [Singulisphaera sp. GP187]|uniref:hypothetical protein n=1 Tax=Singulisphaera sp. GP187 TaxID=1882752 RepID=UPI00094069A9|nr:hypothetical protein [Singulisphaera sp. GP187]
MQTNSVPEIEQSDLKAARDFLTSLRTEERPVHPTHTHAPAHNNNNQNTTRGTVTVRNGITRARTRSAAKTSA